MREVRDMFAAQRKLDQEDREFLLSIVYEPQNAIDRYPYRTSYAINHPLDWIRWWYGEFIAFVQRGRYGWAQCDTFNLSDNLAQNIIGMLRYHRSIIFSYPHDFKSVDEWKLVLDDMILAFCIYELLDDLDYDWENDTERILINELECLQRYGMYQFIKHFGALWE